MGIMSYENAELTGDEFRTAHLPFGAEILESGEIIGNGPKCLDAMGADLSLDDVVLDLDDVFN